MKQNIKKEDNYEVTANSKDNIDAEWQMNSSVREYDPGWAQMQDLCFSGSPVSYNHSSQGNESTGVCQVPQLL